MCSESLRVELYQSGGGGGAFGDEACVFRCLVVEVRCGCVGGVGGDGRGVGGVFNTVGRVVRVMPWWVSLGGTAFGWTQHSVLVALSCRPSGVMCLMTVRSAWVMFPWGVMMLTSSM